VATKLGVLISTPVINSMSFSLQKVVVSHSLFFVSP